MNKPIVWTIAGSDSGGGAGIQADLATFQALSVYGCSVITALTAQNSTEVRSMSVTNPAMLMEQLTVLAEDLPAKAIKLGALVNQSITKQVGKFLSEFPGIIVCDPVMVATSGGQLFDRKDLHVLKDKIFPYVDVLTPNHDELKALTDLTPGETAVEVIAERLLSYGVKSVLLKNIMPQANDCHDYWTNGKKSFYLSQPKIRHGNNHGSGCTLSAAIAACLALGYSMEDAIVIAKMYVTQGIRHATRYGAGPGPVAHLNWPNDPRDLPCLTKQLEQPCMSALSFADCGSEPLGFYPIVDRIDLLTNLLSQGVRTIQLRIKNKSGNELEQDIHDAIQLANAYHSRLFINDHWQMALKYNGYGVHLGQADMLSADLKAIAHAGMRLGVSTHNYEGLARAHKISPSYIAFGPIFETQTKQMTTKPQGLERLRQWRELVRCQLVAIGGIKLENLTRVLACGVDGIAVVSAITQSQDPICQANKFIEQVSNQDVSSFSA